MRGRLLLLALLAGSPAAWAAEVPEALMYQGAPIDPNCLTGGEREPVVALADCSTHPDILPDPDGWSPGNEEDGWQGYAYRYADIPEESMGGWAGWRHVGTVADGEVVETLENGGGTGWFSSLQVVRREPGDALRTVRTVAGGDRCNGGLEAAGVVGGKVAASVRLTSYDLFEWALREAGRPPLADDTPIPFCAICCVGLATFIDEAPLWVTLTPERFLDGRMEEGEDACAATLLQETADAGRTILTPDALAVLGRSFDTRCRP